jgi:hypothetical protein
VTRISSKRLPSAVRASAYQKEWFAGLRQAASDGEPLALVNADAPQEILRAMGIPYVVNQWWASVVSAKRLADRSLDAVRDRGFPDYSRQYDAVSYGASQLSAEEAPWGGLPTPDFVIAETSGDSARKVFDLWEESGKTEFFPFERSSAVTAPSTWWELVPHRWEEAFGKARLDLMTDENWQLVSLLERRTGRKFDVDRLARVMDLVNEQAEWNRRTRDLLAATRPAPIGVHDIINSVMIPQWHRGTEWARDAAEALYHEVRKAVDEGAAVCPEEKTRLMWIGRGLWFDMDLYSRFERDFGAVFVWSMYLAIAADGYPRYGGDPMRALAARFAGFTDQLYMPGWAEEWYVKEALSHGVDGVVHLIADDVPGAHFTTQALENAGIPVLEIRANNADPRSSDPRILGEAISDFLGTRIAGQ